MKFLWHFMKSNIKYNKIELAISYGATLIVFGLFSYFKGDSKEYAGDLLISTAFYLISLALVSGSKFIKRLRDGIWRRPIFFFDAPVNHIEVLQAPGERV